MKSVKTSAVWLVGYSSRAARSDSGNDNGRWRVIRSRLANNGQILRDVFRCLVRSFSVWRVIWTLRWCILRVIANQIFVSGTYCRGKTAGAAAQREARIENFSIA